MVIHFGDVEDEAASHRVVSVVAAVIEPIGLRGDDAVDAIRTFRSALHGFVSLEAKSGFGLPVNVERSFERLVGALTTVLLSWSPSA